MSIMKLLLTLFTISFAIETLEATVDSEAYMPLIEYCKYLKYPISNHFVTTSDGYILQLFRIGSKSASSFNSGTPVFMQHGLVDSADDWLVNTEELAPGFILANKGYDVWLGNTRGNHHSRNHTTLNPETDKAFWEYTWNDMAEFDVPAQVDYILEKTSNSNLVYVGHSQGTTILMARLATHQEFAEKIKLAVFLAPVASVRNQNSKIVSMGSKTDFFMLMRLFGMSEIFKKNSPIMPFICQNLQLICSKPIELLADSDISVDNLERLGVITGHYPSSDSLKNLQMWTQMIKYKENKLQKFDYGNRQKNLEIYGVSSPPLYDLTKIKANLGIFAGVYDRLADQEDVQWLKTQLVNANISWYKDDYELGHGSFMWAKDSTWFNDVISLIENQLNH